MENRDLTNSDASPLAESLRRLEVGQSASQRIFEDLNQRLEGFQTRQDQIHEQLLLHFQQREAEYKSNLADKEKICRDLSDHLAGCAMRLAELQNQLGIQKNRNYDLQVDLDRWAAVERSRGWKALQSIYKARLALVPRGSHIERLLKLNYKAARKLFRLAKSPVRILKRRFFSAPYAFPAPAQSGTNGSAEASPVPRFVRTPAMIEPLEPVEVKGLVSVVLPVYNHAKMLKGAIESVLAQTYRHFELIVVNDGSTDGVERVLAEYAGHPQVRILTQPNQKVSAAVNNGFQFARGEFWTWTSADNLMLPEQLSRQVAYLQSHGDVAMVYSDYMIIDEEGRPAKDPTFRPHNRYSPEDPMIHLPRSTELLNVVLDNFIGACFMYRASAARLIGDYDPGLGIDDYDYWMRMNMSFNIAHTGDELLYQYRVHENSLSAHASELGIYASVHKLMAYQQERAVFFDKPWTIYADDETSKMLADAKTAPHCLVPWAGQSVESDGMDKKLILVHSSSLPTVAASDPPPDVVVAAWFEEDGFAPYKYRNEIRRLDAACFSRSDTALERLGLFTARRFRINTPETLLSQLICFANNRVFMNATRSIERRRRTAPQTLLPSQRRLKVLLQADDFTQGGLEAVVLDLASSLDRRAFDPLLLVLGRQGPAVAEARARGIRVATLPKESREDAYRKLLEDEQIDLVNAHYSLFGGYIASEKGIPFVQTVHNTYIWLPSEQCEDHLANDRFTTAYLCVSPLVAQYSDIKLGLSARKMIVVPNGIDLARLEPKAGDVARDKLREFLGLASDDYVFLNVASIAPAKAQRELVQAFVRVVADCPKAKLVLLGNALDLDYTAEVIQLIKELDLERSVIVAGHHKQIAAFYRAADAFVLPSYYEGWSLAMNEAVCARLPVIATDVGGAADLLGEVGGKLVATPYGSIVDLDRATLDRYLQTYDPRLIEDLAQAMISTYRERPRPVATEAIRQKLSAEHTYQLYEQIFFWIAQGGEASSARPWITPPSNVSLADLRRAA